MCPITSRHLYGCSLRDEVVFQLLVCGIVREEHRVRSCCFVQSLGWSKRRTGYSSPYTFSIFSTQCHRSPPPSLSARLRDVFRAPCLFGLAQERCGDSTVLGFRESHCSQRHLSSWGRFSPRIGVCFCGTFTCETLIRRASCFSGSTLFCLVYSYHLAVEYVLRFSELVQSSRIRSISPSAL